MSKLKIQHFGPIREGFVENDGWMDMKKVTIFIGDQATGKSTIAKVFSTMSWMEKDFERKNEPSDVGPFHEVKIEGFKEEFDQHRLAGYFKDDSCLVYQGSRLNITNTPEAPPYAYMWSKEYEVPKIIYVPAERNFLTAVEQPWAVKGLAKSLKDFYKDLDFAQRSYNEPIGLPIGNLGYYYDEAKRSGFIKGEDYTLNLLEASSGLQSAIPVYIISKFFSESVSNPNMPGRQHLSLDAENQFKKSILESLEKTGAGSKTVKVMEEMMASRDFSKILAKTGKDRFLNVVEEPEQNLFPTSQRGLLNSLLAFNNETEGNQLVLTTHSPYILYYLSLATQGYLTSELIEKAGKPELQKKLEEIVPRASMISPDDVAIYQTMPDGTIERLPFYEGIPSDENLLNGLMGEVNDEFDALIDLEEEL